MCNKLSHLRKKIEMRKLEIFKCCEKLEGADRICKEKVIEIKEKVGNIISDDETDEVSTVQRLSILMGKKETVKEIEDLIQSVERIVDECSSGTATCCKDDLVVTQSKVEKFKHQLNERISSLKKMQEEQGRCWEAAEKIRKFVELKSMQFQSKSTSKIERQLSEANKCCLEIEHEERELFSPINRARALLSGSDRRAFDEFEKVADEVSLLWHSFESEAKTMQSEIAEKYKVKQEVIEEVKSLHEMLRNVKQGITNFQMNDLMSLVECEEEIGDLYDGFVKRQEKIEMTFERADEFCSVLSDGDTEEVKAMTSRSKDMNCRIKVDFQEKMHALESVSKRFNMLRKIVGDKEMFVDALKNRINIAKRQELSTERMLEDYEKVDQTLNEVEEETKQVIENLQSIKDDLPENEADQCGEMICSLEKRLSGLMEVGKLHHMELKKQGASQLQMIYDRLVDFQNSDGSERDEDLNEMEKNLSQKALAFEEITEKIDELKSASLTLDCQEASVDESNMFCNVIALKEAIEVKINDERCLVENAKVGKMELEDEIMMASRKLEEIKGILSFTAEEKEVGKRHEELMSLKEELEDVESRLSEKLDDFRIAFIPTSDGEEIKRQLSSLIDHAAECRCSIEDQLSYADGQMTQNELEQFINEIVEMESNDHSLNEKELEKMSQRLECFASRQCSEEFPSLYNDAVKRLSTLLAKVKSEVFNPDIQNSIVIHEDEIDAQLKMGVESLYPTEDENMVEMEIVVMETKPDADKENLECSEEKLQATTAFVDFEAGLFVNGMDEPLQHQERELKSLEVLQKRIKKHSENIQIVDGMAIELSKENSLQHCINSVRHCIETVGFVLDDIPNLRRTLDDHAKQGSVDEASQLSIDLQNLEDSCSLTRNNLIGKEGHFSDLKESSINYESKLKDLSASLELVARMLVEQPFDYNGNTILEAQEIIETAKAVLSERMCGLSVNLLSLEAETLMQAEVKLKERLHEVESLCVRQLNLKKMNDSRLKFESIQCILSKCSKEIEEVKYSEASPDSIHTLEMILGTVEGARNEAIAISANVNEDLGDLADELIEELKAVAHSVEDSFETVDIEAKHVMKSKQLLLQVGDELEDVQMTVAKLEQRCDKILTDGDLISIIEELNDSIKEILNVKERILEIQRVVDESGTDLEPEEVMTLRAQLDSIASRNLEIQQKFAFNCMKFEQTEKSKEDLSEALQEIKSSMNELDKKIEGMGTVSSIQDLQDVLKLHELELQDSNLDLEKKIEIFEKYSEFLHVDIRNHLESEIDLVRKTVGEKLRKLEDMQKWVAVISDGVDDVKGKINRGFPITSMEFEDEISVSEDQAKNRIFTLKEFVNELTRCQDRINVAEIGKGFQEVEESNDIGDRVIRGIVNEFTEKMKEQIMCAKDDALKRISIEQEKVSLLQISSAVPKLETSLDELHYFVQSPPQENDREKDIKTAIEYVRRTEKQEEDVVKQLELLGKANDLKPEKTKLTDKLEGIRNDLEKARDEVIVKYETLRNIEKQVIRRNIGFKTVTQQIEAIEGQKWDQGEEDVDSLRAKIVHLTEMQKLVSSLKNNIRECSAQDEELFNSLPENEKLRLENDKREVEEMIEMMESAVAKDINETELVLGLRQNIREIRDLNENLSSFYSKLANEKIIAESSIISNFADFVEKLNVSFSEDNENVKELLEECRKEKEAARVLMAKVKRVNEELMEGKEVLGHAENELGKIHETLEEGSMKKGDLALQVEQTKDGIEEKTKAITKMDQIMSMLEGASANIPLQDYTDMKRKIVNLRDACKEEVENELQHLSKLTEIDKSQKVLKERSRALFSMHLDSPDLSDCSLDEVKDKIDGINVFETKLASVVDEIAEQLAQIENRMELLSEKEMAEFMKLKEDVEKKTENLTRNLETGKSHCDVKLRTLNKLHVMKNHLESICSQIDKVQCTIDDEVLSDKIEEVKRQVETIMEELNEVKIELKEDDLSLSKDQEISNDMTVCAARAEEILAKCRIYENCIKKLDRASEAVVKDFSIEKSRIDFIENNDNLTLAEKGQQLQDLKEGLRSKELVMAELKEDLEEDRECIEDVDFSHLMSKVGFIMEEMQKEIDTLSERISNNEACQQYLNESKKDLKEVNDRLNSIGDIDVADVDNSSIDDAVDLVNLQAKIIDNGTADVEKIWSKVESGDMKCADEKDLLLDCAKLSKKLGQLKLSNDEKCIILGRKSGIKSTMEKIRGNLDVLRSVDETFDVKSADGQKKLEGTHHVIAEIEKQLDDVDGGLLGSEFDEGFIRNSTCDCEELRNMLEELKGNILVKTETCQKTRDLKLAEEKLDKMQKFIDDLAQRQEVKGSFEEQLVEINTSAELVNEMLENFENPELSTFDIVNDIPESDGTRLKESLRTYGVKLVKSKKTLDEKRDEILTAKKDWNMKQSVGKLRSKLKEIEEGEIVGNSLESLESRKKEICLQVRAIEELENEINQVSIEYSSSSTSEIDDLKEEIKRKKENMGNACELVTRKIEVMSELEQLNNRVADIDTAAEALEVCDESGLNTISRMEERTASAEDKLAELQLQIESLGGTSDDICAMSKCIDELSCSTGKVKNILSLSRVAGKAFSNLKDVLSELPLSDQSLSGFLENSEGKDALDSIIEVLKKEDEMYEKAYQDCQELNHVLNSISNDGINMVRTTDIASDFLFAIQQRKESIMHKLKEWESVKEQYHSFTTSAQEAKVSLNGIECVALPSFTMADIDVSLASIQSFKDELASIERRIQGMKEAVSSFKEHFPTSLKEKMLKDVIELEDELCFKYQHVNSFEESAVKMKTVMRDIVDTKAEVDGYSRLLQDEAFWISCIEGTDSIHSKFEAFENVPSRMEDIEKNIYSMTENRDDINAKDVLIDLEDERKTIVDVKEEMKRKQIEISKIRELLRKVEEMDGILKGIDKGLIWYFSCFDLHFS